MIGPDFEKAMVALAAWREMRGDGVNGMLAVLFVLRNRAQAGWHNGSLYENAIAKNQFSSLTVLGDTQTILYPDPREPQFQALLQRVDQVYDGVQDVLTNGAMYYAVLHDATSSWFQKNIVEKPDEHPRVAQVGRTTFFK